MPKIPWGLVLALAGLAAVVTIVLGLGPGYEHGAPWLAIASVVLAGWALFVSERWLQNYVWGLLAALVFCLHPYVMRWANDGESLSLLWAETLTLIALAANIFAWRVLFQRAFAPLSWIVATVIVSACIGVAWVLEPRNGLVTGVLTFGSLLLGSILAVRKHREASLCWGNISVVGLLAFVVPAAGLALAVLVMPSWQGFPRSTKIPESGTVWELLEAAFLPPAGGDLHLIVSELERSGMAAACMTIAMMVVGSWRSLRRGWKRWRVGLAPLAWVLTLFAFVDLAGILLHPPRAASIALVSFAPLAVILNVFGFADLAQGLGERLVLAPPQTERATRIKE